MCVYNRSYGTTGSSEMTADSGRGSRQRHHDFLVNPPTSHCSPFSRCPNFPYPQLSPLGENHKRFNPVPPISDAIAGCKFPNQQSLHFLKSAKLGTTVIPNPFPLTPPESARSADANRKCAAESARTPRDSENGSPTCRDPGRRGSASPARPTPPEAPAPTPPMLARAFRGRDGLPSRPITPNGSLIRLLDQLLHHTPPSGVH